jgi:ABC-type phosphate transport system ATPase subunit
LHAADENDIRLNPTNKCSPENSLMWKNISKWADYKTKELQLLQNVSGRLKAREVIAVMGHSGCGKVCNISSC